MNQSLQQQTRKINKFNNQYVLVSTEWITLLNSGLLMDN